jgi:hypothetical protein
VLGAAVAWAVPDIIADDGGAAFTVEGGTGAASGPDDAAPLDGAVGALVAGGGTAAGWGCGWAELAPEGAALFGVAGFGGSAAGEPVPDGGAGGVPAPLPTALFGLLVRFTLVGAAAGAPGAPGVPPPAGFFGAAAVAGGAAAVGAGVVPLAAVGGALAAGAAVCFFGLALDDFLGLAPPFGAPVPGACGLAAPVCGGVAAGGVADM